MQSLEDLTARAVLRYFEKADQRLDAPAINCGKPRSVWLGVLLSLAGSVFLALVVQSTLDGDAQGNILVGIVVPLVFIMIGGWLITYRDECLLDTTRAAWTRQLGYVPFARSWTGSFKEIASVELVTELRYAGGRSRQKFEYWVTKLTFKDAIVPPAVVDFLLIPRGLVDEGMATQLAQKLADRLGVPLVNRHET